VLSGAHTFGFTQCENFRARIYNDTNINGQFAKQRQGGCPAASGSGDANLAPLDVTTQDAFDNAFYANLLLKKKGLPHSDQELYNGGSQDKLVRQYAYDQAFFFADFVTAMINMGNISPLTGTAGQTGTTAEWLINCCCCYISCFDRVSEDTCMQPSSSTVVTEKEHVSCTI
jgi:peroxidase